MEEKTENIAVANENESSASFGKFKTAEELLKAYNSLQSEFTKRSQKLAEYEKNSGSVWEGKVAEFVKQYPVAEKYADELAEEIAKNADVKNEFVLERSLLNVLSGKIRSDEEIVTDEKVVEKVLNFDENREKVIKGYLENLRKNPTPITLPQGGAIPVAPPVKAKSIREAGEIAKKLLESQL